MALTDLPIEQLRSYRPEVVEPDDFDEFWRRTLNEARAIGGVVDIVEASTPIRELIVEDLTFPGYGGEPIRAWITRPRTEGRLPAVVEYIGYNGGRGVAGERLQWAAAGYVHVLMDTRGQGSGWGTGGDTADPHGSEGAVPGFMTRGISAPETYYYRRVFTDAVRLIDAVREFEFVDPARVSITGASQGGGIALAAAALVPGLSGVMPDVPFLCHFSRSVQMTPDQPFMEITRYLAVHRDQDERVFRTLSYFDGVNFARRVHVPALFSVALMDGIVLPSSVFAAYNHLGVEDRAIEVYTYNGHEGGQTHQWVRQAEWLATRVAP
ncbi:acetylxylan esterase [Microbacterium abyssi]|uniref:acetylxylan esterase n=1 Tax=Microbacterium abyssi TaxID=2782166 RepID=UPI00188740CE|nr:acetylxylan esterase [Microbacterium sp. A18JL241]